MPIESTVPGTIWLVESRKTKVESVIVEIRMGSLKVALIDEWIGTFVELSKGSSITTLGKVISNIASVVALVSIPSFSTLTTYFSAFSLSFILSRLTTILLSSHDVFVGVTSNCSFTRVLWNMNLFFHSSSYSSTSSWLIVFFFFSLSSLKW